MSFLSRFTVLLSLSYFALTVSNGSFLFFFFSSSLLLRDGSRRLMIYASALVRLLLIHKRLDIVLQDSYYRSSVDCQSWKNCFEFFC